jgi:hypothetical protein
MGGAGVRPKTSYFVGWMVLGRKSNEKVRTSGGLLADAPDTL